jgi:hypothetical protein
MDILDNEASEDEAARKAGSIQRPPSHEANQELVNNDQKYRSMLEKAAVSDELVRRKWDEWEMNIRELTWDEACHITATLSTIPDLIYALGPFNGLCSVIHCPEISLEPLAKSHPCTSSSCPSRITRRHQIFSVSDSRKSTAPGRYRYHPASDYGGNY